MPVTPATNETLLTEARQKAIALLEALLRDQADLQRTATTLTVQAVSEGRAAHAAAVDAARWTIDNLERSLEGTAMQPSETPTAKVKQD